MLGLIQFVVHSAQAALSAYALYHASIAIPKLQAHEATSERAAKYSSTAAVELSRTRKTQTVGTVAIISSLLASIALTMNFVSPGYKSLAMNLGAGAATAFASVYMTDYWGQKSKIPLMTGYNAAVDSTKVVREHLALVGTTWLLSSVFEIFRIATGSRVR